MRFIIPSFDKVTKSDDIIESQSTHSPISSSQNMLQEQPDGAIGSQQTDPLTSQNKSEDIIEESPEVIDNIENSSHVNDTPNGEQPSPYYSPPQSFTDPFVSQEEEKEPVSLQEGGDDKYPSINSSQNYSSFSSGASNFPPSQPFTNPSFQQPNSSVPLFDLAGNGVPLFEAPLYYNNNSVLQLQNELYQARFQIYQLEQENQRLNAATQESEKAEELKSAFFAYLEKKGEELQGQIQRLTDESKEENKEQEIVGLLQRLGKINEFLETEELNTEVIEELNKDAPSRELGEENEQMEELNAEVEKLKKDLEAKNTEVQQLQKEKKELEAKKQPTEQSKAPTYTAAVGCGLAAGLVAFIALERTVRLDIWATVGIALVAALAVSGATYLALKPSTQVGETREPQQVNRNAHQPT
ncbi:MAG: hypothetical protein LBU02_03265 [Rickettsiales bacterium]|nr:hypothetical protein [Rickettsiales bacterium]